MKPKVFVSSTILDFDDLRSAIKYYLEEYGFEVQMSEFPNFDVDRDYSAFDSCLKNLDRCQYYILLIGYRRGSWYEKDKLSITHKEYQTAKTLIENGHPLRMIAFVRKPIWLIKDDREALFLHFKKKSKKLASAIKNAGTGVIDDPQYIFAFLNEIAKGVSTPGSSSPVNNWIFSFDGFADIAQALRNSFNLTGTLVEKRLQLLLLEELKQNLKKFYMPGLSPRMKSKGITEDDTTQENILDFFKEDLYPDLALIWGDVLVGKKKFSIAGSKVGELMIYSTIFPNMTGMWHIKTTILEKIISEGIFLSFDVRKDDFQTNLLTFALEKLLEWINQARNFYESPTYQDFTKEIARISTDGSAYIESVPLSTQTAATIMLLAWSEKIPNLISCILKTLTGEDTTLLAKFDFTAQDIFNQIKRS